MLPPFRVRNSNSGRSRLAKTDFDAVVRICAPDYDLTVQACPEAKLKYFDEEDGEIVTVHSKPYFKLIYCHLTLFSRLALRLSLFSASKAPYDSPPSITHCFLEVPARPATWTSPKHSILLLFINIMSSTSKIVHHRSNCGEKFSIGAKDSTLPSDPVLS